MRSIKLYNVLVLIPVHEMEAWLLCDSYALKAVFGLSKKPKVPTRPETIPDAKEKLRDVIWATGKKRYINTIHNAKISAVLDLATLEKCPSFKPLPAFVGKYIT